MNYYQLLKQYRLQKKMTYSNDKTWCSRKNINFISNDENSWISKNNSTIGFNIEKLDYKGLRFTIWDVGGQDKISLIFLFLIYSQDYLYEIWYELFSLKEYYLFE